MTTHPIVVQPAARTLRFIRRGEVVNLGNVPPGRTVLELLREDLGCTGTKEGCGEGDCGACTVVLGQIEDGALRFRAINSCIRLAHSIDGMALWTVEDIAEQDGTLHPAQQAMVQCHASQCGFCTPGFVMSLFGMYQNYVAPTLGPAALNATSQPITRALAQEELSGNLCRCTGYRPILDAAQIMGSLPPVAIDHDTLLSKLELLAQAGYAQEVDSAYKLPYTLADLLKDRAAHPTAQLVAGCTDVGLWVTKQHRQFGEILDLTQVEELRHIEDQPDHLLIGAAVTLADAFGALIKDRPQLHNFASRFAGLPVRNSGTLGGNIANGSPIGDSMPLLIALNARIVLMSEHGQREMALEALYTGYRQTVMAADEVLAFIRVPKATPEETLKVYKISKRYDDDISAVCLAIKLHIDQGVVARASIGAGGVAATPARAVQTEAFLTGQPWTLDTVRQAMNVLRAEFSPISDMRASSAYRTEVLGKLLERYWLESQGMQQINLASFMLEETP
ncbi:xanthine dehydrogenase small subunit [Polaromonas naphthalenivorans]|uniref:Molybdopterin dehydrogenase, FAD-binding protein n=1 Tax=Polaromonas naphthalenivorans (strain CJ2) TaxID=365044 RepID=A1VL24_POLNA|nr:xanthine dehydrogenase small subunit [Polaromonas naphthalenivorans]ABM36352.1 molybdopterin dehydrogenase, FAD-binding protein [Polaromonas naphthalenivorans CJ2]